MQQLINRYFSFLKGFLTFMLIVLIIPVMLQIISRLVPFVPSYIWTEEISRLAFIWIIMIGSSIAVRNQTHFHVDILPKYSEKTENLLHTIKLMLMLLLAITFIVGGYQYSLFGLKQHSEISGLPMLAIYIAWPLAGFSWMLFLVEQIYQHFHNQQNA